MRAEIKLYFIFLYLLYISNSTWLIIPRYGYNNIYIFFFVGELL